MTAFRFRLQKVLEHREETEREKARGLAEARAESDAALRARVDLESVREEGRSRLMTAHGTGRAIGHLQNMAFVLEQVDEQILSAEAACQQADEHVVEHLKGYRQAIQDRKTIDHLRERRFHQWRADEAREEQKAMDEVALTRHNRSDGSPSVGDRTD